jgi:cold-inducible RNA-binding protein
MTFQCSIFFPVFRMNNKLFVGNLSFKLSEAELESLFGEFGTVVSCSIPTDRETGRKRGFAFVEMGSQAEAEAAIKGLNGRDCEGRQIAVSIAQPKAAEAVAADADSNQRPTRNHITETYK